MPSTYAQNKENIYRWRSKPENMARQLEINKIYKRKYDAWLKISKIFFNILII